MPERDVGIVPDNCSGPLGLEKQLVGCLYHPVLGLEIDSLVLLVVEHLIGEVRGLSIED